MTKHPATNIPSYGAAVNFVNRGGVFWHSKMKFLCTGCTVFGGAMDGKATLVRFLFFVKRNELDVIETALKSLEFKHSK